MISEYGTWIHYGDLNPYLKQFQLINISHAAYSSALSLFPDMKEHEGLLTSEELASIVPDTIDHPEGFAENTINKGVGNNKMLFSQFLQDFANREYLEHNDCFLFRAKDELFKYLFQIQ